MSYTTVSPFSRIFLFAVIFFFVFEPAFHSPSTPELGWGCARQGPSAEATEPTPSARTDGRADEGPLGVDR